MLTPLGATEVEDVVDDSIGERFRLFFGWCGEAPLELLVVTDGNGLFGVAVDLVRLLQLPALVPSMLVVGVGYASASTISDTVSARVRDLTPSPVPEFPGSGGANAFRRFLRSTVLPRSRVVAPTLQHATYFGHSLGGLFGVHDLLAADRLFDRHIISSPSLWWDNHALLHDELPEVATGDAFFCIGGDETDEGRRREGAALPEEHPFKPKSTYLDMVDDLQRFLARLQARGDKGLRLASLVLPDEYHTTSAPVALTRGLRWLFEGR